MLFIQFRFLFCAPCLQRTLINYLCVRRAHIRCTIYRHFWIHKASFTVVKFCVVNSKTIIVNWSQVVWTSLHPSYHSNSITSLLLSFILLFLMFCKGPILKSPVKRSRKLIALFSSVSTLRSALNIPFVWISDLKILGLIKTLACILFQCLLVVVGRVSISLLLHHFSTARLTTVLRCGIGQNFCQRIGK